MMSLPRQFMVAAVIGGLGAFAGSATAQDDGVRLDVPFVPTPQGVVDRMLEMARVTRDDYVIDLGSGDGRIAITAASRYGARTFGVDIDPQRVREANENARRAGVTDRVTFRQQNLFDTKIGDATVLTMYLLPRVNLELRPRVLDELRPGTRVVSHAFNMGDWGPDEQDSVDGSGVYLWIVPARVEGRWTVQQADGGRFTIDLEQHYQRIEGTVTMNGRSVPLRSVTLRGADISFVVEAGDGGPLLFSGRVDGDRIEAVPAAAGAASPVRHAQGWRASRGS